MANTTKSTRKKPVRTTKSVKATKTTVKKTPAKSVRATKTAKTVPVVTTKKADVSTKSAQRTALTPLERLRSLHISKAVIYLLGAGLILGFVKAVEATVTLGIVARDEFASQQNTVLTPAHEVLYNIDPRYVLVTSLGLAALGSILLATKLRNRYEATLSGRTSGFRWVILGVSAALTLTFVNMLAGVHDMATLKLAGGLIFLTTMLSWLAERDNIGAVKPKWLAYIVALFAGALALLPLIGSLIGTTLFSEERFGWHVYALAAVMIIGFIGFALTQYRSLRRGPADVYLETEERYLRIDMLTKFAIVLIVLLALK